MKSSIFEKAERFLREQKGHKRWLAVVACLAVFVVLGTLGALKYTGTAMTHKQDVLDCQYQVHKHTDACYDAEHNLICGYADVVIHTHNDDCYDANGNLVCKLPEVKLHKQHDPSCYTEQSVLVCTLPEGSGHVHSEACYTLEKGEQICQLEEHTHSAACYDAAGNLICGLEEHTHDDACFKWNSVLTCGQEEYTAHTHSASCYQTQQVLTCTQLAQDLHTHTEKCYDQNGNLICGLLQLEEHVHNADCIKTVELTDEEIATLNAETSAVETAEETAAETVAEESTMPESAGIGESIFFMEEETTAAEESQETVADVAETEIFSQTAETTNYVVTVSYTNAANLPENALLQVIEYAKDSERFLQRTEELGYEPDWLLNIGFFVDGVEVEPAAPVDVKVVMKGQEEVGDYDIVHFAEDGQEEINGIGVEDETGISAEFTLSSFSDVAGTYASISGSQLTMEVGEAYTLKGTSNIACNYSQTWKASGTGVISVDSSGKVTALAVGDATVSHTYCTRSDSHSKQHQTTTEYFYVTVTSNSSSSATTVKVPVYATDGHTTGTIDNTALKEILGLPFQQADSYFPVGVVELPRSLFEGKTSPYIKSAEDKNAVLNAISQISTSELQNAGAANASNTVAENLEYVQLDTNAVDNTYQTALFDWPYLEYDNTTRSVFTGSGDTNIVAATQETGIWSSTYNQYIYRYHLDIRFATATIQYIGVYESGTTVELAEGVYLAGHEILEPEASNLAIPEGYTAEGYFKTRSGAQNNNSNDAYEFGGTMEADTTTTVYVRLVERIDITAQKVWADSDTVSEHPAVVLTLYKTVDGVTTSTGRSVTLDGTVDTSAKDDKETEPWKAEFRYLPQYEAGKKITYLVEEDSIPSGYQIISVTGNETEGFTVVNAPYNPQDITGDMVDNGYKLDKTIKSTTVENEYEITLTIQPSIQWPSEDTITSETFEEVLSGSAVWIVNSNNSGSSVASGLLPDSTATQVRDWLGDNIGGKSQTGKLCGTLADAQNSNNATNANKYKKVSHIKIAGTDIVVDGYWYYCVPQESANSFTILIIPKNGDSETQPVLKIGDVSYDSSTETLTLPEAAYEFLSKHAMQYVTGTHLKIGDWDNATLNVPERVVDPMGEYIDFLNFVQLDGTNGTSNPIQSSYSKATYYDSTTLTETILWDGFSSLLDISDSDKEYTVEKLANGHSIYYYKEAYTLTYRVRVDVLKDGFVSKQDYDANKPTYLVDGEEQFDFPIPKAKGYLGSFTLVKTGDGDDGPKLKDATFSLTCKQTVEENPVAYNLTHPNALTATTDANGQLIFDKLPWGTYELAETNVPSGYLAIAPITVTVSEGKVSIADNRFDAVTQTISIVDPSNKAFVKVYKVADGNPSGRLGGAEFEVTSFTDNWISSSEEATLGLLYEGELKEGTYTLTETVAPGGYNLAEGQFVITITRNAETNSAAVSLEYKGQKQPGMVEFDSKTRGYKIYISNTSGVELPMTGGPGTTLYTFGGIAILAIGLMFGFSMRRVRERRSR